MRALKESYFKNFKFIDETTRVYCKTVETYFCKLFQKISRVVDVELLGSVSRETYIKHPKDFDFFLFYRDLEGFELQAFRLEVEALLKDHTDKTLLKLTHMESKHRGFPYLKVILAFQGRTIDLDVIPCLKDRSEFQSVERTKQHDVYMKARLTDDHKYQIRKLKHLLKRNNLYGAQSHIGGLSGYACEVLIERYGLIKNIPSDLRELEDPIDPSRNLLAPLSEQTLNKFHFLKHHSFKNVNRYRPDYEGTVYCWEDAPLKLLSTLRKHKNVLSAIYVSNTIYLEVRSYYCKVDRSLGYDNLFFRESKSNHYVYFSVNGGIYKKHHYSILLDQYPKLMQVQAHETKRLKTFYFFK